MKCLVPLIAILVASGSQSVRAAEPAPPSGKALNPDYSAWCDFPNGTAIAVKTVGSGPGIGSGTPKEWTVTEATTLREVSPDKVELEVRKTKQEDGGKEVKSPPRKVTYARWIDAPRVGKPTGTVVEEEETITVLGKKVKARYVRIQEENFDAEGSIRITKEWTSQEVPGRIIKSVGDQTGTYWYKERVELVEFTKPPK